MEYKNMLDEVLHLYHCYGADYTSDEGLDRVLKITDVCIKEIDAHPEIEKNLDTPSAMNHFIIQMILDKWPTMKTMLTLNHISDVVQYLSASKHVRELKRRMEDIPKRFGTFYVNETGDPTSVAVTNYYGDYGCEFSEYQIDFEDNGLPREHIIIENGIDQIAWVWEITEDDIDDIVCDLKSYYEEGEFDGCPSGDDFDYKYDVYAEKVIVPYLKSIAQRK